MSLRLYIAPRVFTDRIHNVLRDIVPHLRFEEIKNDGDMVGLCLVDTTDANHAILAADARVIPLTRAAASPDGLTTDMDGAIPARLQTMLTAQGIGGPTTLREAVAAIARRFIHRDVDARIARGGLRVGGVQL